MASTATTCVGLKIHVQFLESDADEQLIIRIPFTEAVKIKYICVSGGSDGAAPEKLKLFVNREDIDFDNVEDTKPVQELELAPHVGHDVDYPLNYSRFQCVRTLEIFIPSNFGDDVTRMYYLGFKGKGTNNKRQIVEATYEARAIPSDHKAIEENRNVSQLGM